MMLQQAMMTLALVVGRRLDRTIGRLLGELNLSAAPDIC